MVVSVAMETRIVHSLPPHYMKKKEPPKRMWKMSLFRNLKIKDLKIKKFQDLNNVVMGLSLL